MKYDMFFLAALLAIAGLRAIVLSFFSNAAESTATITSTIKPIEVETTLTKKVLSLGRTSLNGTVEAVETVTTTSHVIGQIKTLPVQEGDTVKAGQIIAIIDVKNIQAQRNQVSAAISQAQASLTVATAAQTQALANKTQAQAQLNHATARYQEAEIKLQEAQAQLGEALLNQQRMAMLHKDGAVSQLQLYTANTQVALIEARIEQAKAGIEQAKAAVKQASFQVQQALTEVKPKIANLNHSVVKAPFAGVVTKKHTEVGAIADFGQPLVTLESRNRLRFSVVVPKSMMSLVKQGDEVEVQLDALNGSVRGQVNQIILSTNPKSRSFTAKIALNNATKLMPRMFGRVELPGESYSAIVIPQSALFKRGQLEGVYVVDANNIAQLRWVKTGKIRDSKVEIVSGLKEQERIVTKNIEQLSAGKQVVSLNF